MTRSYVFRGGALDGIALEIEWGVTVFRFLQPSGEDDLYLKVAVGSWFEFWLPGEDWACLN